MRSQHSTQVLVTEERPTFQNTSQYRTSYPPNTSFPACIDQVGKTRVQNVALQMHSLFLIFSSECRNLTSAVENIKTYVSKQEELFRRKTETESPRHAEELLRRTTPCCTSGRAWKCIRNNKIPPTRLKLYWESEEKARYTACFVSHLTEIAKKMSRVTCVQFDENGRIYRVNNVKNPDAPRGLG